MSLQIIPINAVNIRDIFSSFITLLNILYIVKSIPVHKIAANILETRISFAVTFKIIAVSIGNTGVVIILISLYGINPCDIALAVL